MPDEQSQSNIPDGDKTEKQDWEERRKELRRERRPKDPLAGLFWGLTLILLGVLFFANQQGWTTWDNWWQYLLIGLGIIFIIDGLAHLAIPRYRDTSYGRFVPGVILIFVGLAFIYGFSQWWPLILIAAGIAILVSLLFRRR